MDDRNANSCNASVMTWLAHFPDSHAHAYPGTGSATSLGRRLAARLHAAGCLLCKQALRKRGPADAHLTST